MYLRVFFFFIFILGQMELTAKCTTYIPYVVGTIVVTRAKVVATDK